MRLVLEVLLKSIFERQATSTFRTTLSQRSRGIGKQWKAGIRKRMKH